MNVNRKQAEKVLKAVLTRYPEAAAYAPNDRPKILDYDGTLVVSWESGPYEWATRWSLGGFNDELYFMAVDAGVPRQEAERMATDEEAEKISGVNVEPYFSFSLAVHPE